MKKRLAFLLAIASAASFFVFRQTARSEKSDAPQKQSQILSELKPQSFRAVASGVSPKVSSFRDSNQTFKTSDEREVRFVSENLIPHGETGIHDTDQKLASFLPSPMPSPLLSFDGLINRMNGEI